MKYLVALVFFVILHEGALMSISESQSFLERRHTHTQQQLTGYDFIQGMDSSGNDIGNKGTNLQTLKDLCDKTSNCVGFNTNGWVKHHWNARNTWSRFSNDARAGTYEKRAINLDGYNFVQGLDSPGNDIANKGTTLEELRDFCDSRDDCIGFNTNGWVKKAFINRKTWSRFSDAPSAGTYVKQEFRLKGYEFIQGMDSNGNDIGNKGTSLKDLSSFCDSRPDCLGFNTNGWVKNHFKAYTTWDHFSNDPRAGTYVKIPRQGQFLDGYSFIQGIDSSGNDIGNKGTNLQELKKFCDSRSDCVGFNTNGWVKNTFKARTAWDRFSEDPKAGTYVKLPAHAHASLLQVAMESSALNRLNKD